MVEILHFHWGECGFDPWSGNWDPACLMVQPKKEEKKKISIKAHHERWSTPPPPSVFNLSTTLSYPSPKAPAKWLTHWSLRFLAVSIALRGVNSSKDHLFPVCSPPGNLPGFCEWKNVACHISKQRMLQPSRHYSCPQWWAWGNSGWKQTGCPPSSPQPLQPSLVVHPEGTQDGKEWDAGPR